MTTSTSNHGQRLLIAAAEAGLTLVAAGLAWWFEIPFLAQIRGESSWLAIIIRGLLATLPLLLALLWMLRTNWPPLVRMREQVDLLLSGLLDGAPLSTLFLLAAAAGLGEELLFRGAIQPIAAKWLGDWGAVFATALLFGLAHPFSKLYILLATIAGVYFGTLVLLTGETGSAIIAHAAYDAVALLCLCKQTVHPQNKYH